MNNTMQTNEHFEALGKSYVLKRYPYQKNSDLRAWDTADSYLLNTLAEQQIDLSRVAIINDHFGALTLPLIDYQPLVYSDSWCAREAIYQNIESNREAKNVRFISDMGELFQTPCNISHIIGRVPKSKQQLAYLLQQLQQWVNEDCRLLFAGMDKHLSKGQFELLEKYFGPAHFYPGVRKARIWEATVDKALPARPVAPKVIKVSVPTLEEKPLSLRSHPNVFSQDKLDIGSRFFLDNFSTLPEKDSVADLACGNGVLGLSYLKHFPESKLLFVDESFQAVQSCLENCQNNFPSADTTVRAGDGLKQCNASELDLILCNPPFHVQHTVGTDIAISLFKDAFRALKKQGELWVVANRHLAYHVTLKKLFGNCSTEASNKKFVILKTVKYR